LLENKESKEKEEEIAEEKKGESEKKEEEVEEGAGEGEKEEKAEEGEEGKEKKEEEGEKEEGGEGEGEGKEEVEREEKRVEKEGDETSIFGLDKNIAALIAYAGMFFTGILVLILERKNKFVRFHAMQSVVIFLPGVIILSILGWLAWLIWPLHIIVWLGGLLLVMAWLVGMLKAYTGEYFKFPVVGDIAENLLKSGKI